MIKAVTALALCVLLVRAAKPRLTMNDVSSYTEETWGKKFNDFIAKYKKNYDTTEEYNRRLQIYKVYQNIITSNNVQTVLLIV